MSRWIEASSPDSSVVAALRYGREALDRLEQHDPDVVVLDVEMPQLDGISTLPLLLETKRDLVVIMASALTRDNAEVTIKALVARRCRLHSEARRPKAASSRRRLPDAS